MKGFAFTIVAVVLTSGSIAGNHWTKTPSAHNAPTTTVTYPWHGRKIVLHEIGVPHKLRAEPAPTDAGIHAHGVNRVKHYKLTVVR